MQSTAGAATVGCVPNRPLCGRSVSVPGRAVPDLDYWLPEAGGPPEL